MEQVKLADIQNSVDLATKMFEYYLENINWNMAQWIYLEKATIENEEIWFHFKSAGTPLQFKIYGGLNSRNLKSLSVFYEDMYGHFQRIKWNYPVKTK